MKNKRVLSFILCAVMVISMLATSIFYLTSSVSAAPDPKDIDKLVEMNNIGDGVTGGFVGLDRQAHYEIYEIAAGLR